MSLTLAWATAFTPRTTIVIACVNVSFFFWTEMSPTKKEAIEN